MVHIPALLIKHTGIFCSKHAILMQCEHISTHIYRHVWTRCPIVNLHWPCFQLSYKQIFFDYVTVCCITLTRMTNQVWQSNASRFCRGTRDTPASEEEGRWRTSTTLLCPKLLHKWPPIPTQRNCFCLHWQCTDGEYREEPDSRKRWWLWYEHIISPYNYILDMIQKLWIRHVLKVRTFWKISIL